MGVGKMTGAKFIWNVCACVSVWSNLWKWAGIIIVAKQKVMTDNQWKTSMIGTFMPSKWENTSVLFMHLCIKTFYQFDSYVKAIEQMSERKKTTTTDIDV